MFLLLAGATYYPNGADDIKSKHVTIEEANEAAAKIMKDSIFEWYQIFDLEKMEIVY